MKRWNGWGDDAQVFTVYKGAVRFLEQRIGAAAPPRDAAIESVLQTVPASRLPAHPLVSADPLDRLLHARGQSFPDWLALRSGRVPRFPDGVAYPQDGAQVRALIGYAQSVGARIIPFGGGTSVVGHLHPASPEPHLVLALSHASRLLRLDPASQLATFAAGVSGPDLEAQLRAHRLTLGHYPQSFEFSTLGGWVATRSAGTQSLQYGRIEKLFAGGRLQTPAGELVLPVFPASAAGPDLRELVLGSEGRLGILSEVTVRASRLPECEEFHAVFFPDFDQGQAAARQLLQSGLPLAMLRLSSAVETATTLILAGRETLIAALEKLLALRGLGSEKCMLLIGFSGAAAIVRASRGEALRTTARFGGVHVGRAFGREWHKNRFRTPYLRNTLWEMGYGVDTLETAADWERVPGLMRSIETALHTSLEEPSGARPPERVHVFTHLSHLYPSGSSLYTTYLFRLAADPQETLERWTRLKTAASQAIVAAGATISHQHGVGADHAAYLPHEKGALGVAALASVMRTFDPQGLMNPGKLLAAEPAGR